MRLFQAICIISISLLLTACFKNSNAPDVSNVQINFSFVPSEEQLFSCKSKEEISSFLDQNPILAQYFFRRSAYPHDSLVVNRLFKLISDSIIYNETTHFIKDSIDLKKEFTDAFKHLKYYYPNATIPQVKTIISGFSKDLYVSDSLIIVSLDFSLPEEATYLPPSNIPQYILRRYQKEYIVPNSILGLSGLPTFNKTSPKDRSMIADMIFYGKSYYFLEKMIPQAHDSLIIGYTGQELEDLEKNIDVVWAHFIQNKLLYEKDEFTKRKYLDERPNVLEIGNKCPGRIARWLGWQIVRKYAKQERISLPDLMEKTNAQELFEKANYRPTK